MPPSVFLYGTKRADDGEDVACDGALGLADDGEFAGRGGGDVGEPRDDAGDGLAGPDRAFPDVDSAIGVGDAEALRFGRDRDGVGRDRQSGESSSGRAATIPRHLPNRSASTVAGSFSGSGGACCRTARLASVVAAWRRAHGCETRADGDAIADRRRNRMDLSARGRGRRRRSWWRGGCFDDTVGHLGEGEPAAGGADADAGGAFTSATVAPIAIARRGSFTASGFCPVETIGGDATAEGWGRGSHGVTLLKASRRGSVMVVSTRLRRNGR